MSHVTATMAEFWTSVPAWWLLLALQRALPNAQIVGVDISAAMVRKARKNMGQAGYSGLIEVKEAAAAALPFSDGSFDAVVSTGSYASLEGTNCGHE